MIRAQWIGGPKDGDWIDLPSAQPITVIAGTREIPEVRRVVPRKLNRRWILDFYNGAIINKDNPNP